MKLFLSALFAVLFFCSGMYFHDFRVNRVVEILFFGLAVSATLTFEWLLHK